MTKHILFFNGQYVVVWGPASRANTYRLFVKEIAASLQLPLTDAMFAIQLSDIAESNRITDLRAYHYCTIVQNYARTKDFFVLRCDDIFQSRPSFVAPSARPLFSAPPAFIPNREPTILDKLTETLVNKRKLQLDGTLSKFKPGWRERVYGILLAMRQPQTIFFLLAITAVFGFLVSPIR